MHEAKNLRGSEISLFARVQIVVYPYTMLDIYIVPDTLYNNIV